MGQWCWFVSGAVMNDPTVIGLMNLHTSTADPDVQTTTGGAPSRREALFGLVGAGLGVGVTTAYYKGVPCWQHECLLAMG
jgi:hypothetical protein